MISAKSTLLFLGVLGLVLAAPTQVNTPSQTSLILITEDSHQAIDSFEDINQLSKTIQKIKAITLTSENINNLVSELKKVVKSDLLSKQKVSSLFVDNADLQKLENIKFEDILDLQQLKALIEQEGLNLLVQLKEIKSQGRKLQQTTPIQEVKVSPLFLNMNSVTLTGLLVTLFLGVILIIGIKCLYDVKTNDQFGRTGLWIGKES